MVLPTTLVPAPEPGTSAHGLFSALPFRPAEGVRWGGAGVEFEGYETGLLQSYTAVACSDPVQRNLTDKPNSNEFYPATVYGTYSCSLASTSQSEAERLATSRLTGAEEATIEAIIWQLLNEALEEDTEEVENKPIGDQDSIALALGLLEHFLVRNYGGGVIHVPRWLGSTLKNTKTSGATLRTIGGVPIVLGAGYGEPGKAQKIIGTPPLFAYRTDIQVLNTPNLGHNDNQVVAERDYIVGWGSGKPVSVTLTNTP